MLLDASESPLDHIQPAVGEVETVFDLVPIGFDRSLSGAEGGDRDLEVLNANFKLVEALAHLAA